MTSPYSNETEQLILLHYNHLSEKDRRHYAAIEAVKLGRGGTTYISKILGISRTTIIVGKKELKSLAQGVAPVKRQRKAGGGRKKKR